MSIAIGDSSVDEYAFVGSQLRLANNSQYDQPRKIIDNRGIS